MLTKPAGNRTRIAGLIICLSLLAATSFAVWASAPERPATHSGPGFKVEIELTTDKISQGHDNWVSTPTTVELSGLSFPDQIQDNVESDQLPGVLLTLPENGSGWSAEVNVAQLSGELYVVLATIKHNEHTTSSPKMLIKGEQWGSVSLSADEASDPHMRLAVLVHPGE